MTSSETSANATAASTICDPGSSKSLPKSFERVDRDRSVPEEVHVEQAEHLEAREGEDPAVEGHRERGGAEREVDAGEPQRGERDERADRGRDEHRPHERERVAAGAEVGHHDRADAGEAELAQRDLPGVADQRDQRERDDPDGEDLAVGDEVGVAQRWWPHTTPIATIAPAKHERALDRRRREELAAPGHPAAQPGVRERRAAR